MPTSTSPPQVIVDYDGGGYDYRNFWRGRDYELWAEERVLKRLIGQLGRPQWLIDFGGGFGRNAPLYLHRAEHAVLIDYSTSNLERAAEIHAEAISRGKLYLIRADLNHLPFIDGGTDVAMVVRVLHHFPDIGSTLSEMSRVVARRWIVDVPIKHHLLARIRNRKSGVDIANREPIVTGDTQYPFYNFSLSAIRKQFSDLNWQTEVVASVNNFRRWDRVLPHSAVTALRPLVYSAEIAAQRVGRGWWGPSQFLLADRRPALVAKTGSVGAAPSSLAALAARMQCPTCAGELSWSTDLASCAMCHADFGFSGGYWDFVVSDKSTTTSSD